jgi:hypothetical protein
MNISSDLPKHEQFSAVHGYEEMPRASHFSYATRPGKKKQV